MKYPGFGWGILFSTGFSDLQDGDTYMQPLLKPSIIKLELGIKLTSLFQTGQLPFVETLALILAPDDVALASQRDPSVMDPYKVQAARIDYEEAVEMLGFFTQHVSQFSVKLQERLTPAKEKKQKG